MGSPVSSEFELVRLALTGNIRRADQQSREGLATAQDANPKGPPASKATAAIAW